MQTFNLVCEVPPDRIVTLKLPDTVGPGKHELVVVIDAPGPGPRFQDLSAEAQRQHIAALQQRWRDRLSPSDDFARVR
jgi:hypothetical protein